jgi:hypothetical protein
VGTEVGQELAREGYARRLSEICSISPTWGWNNGYE